MWTEPPDRSTSIQPATPAGGDARRRRVAWVMLAVILAASLGLKLNHIGHDALHAMDEAFHAVVARNLLDRPLTPLLYADPAVPYDYRDWKANHVWLHKPILPLWQMAGAMAVLGVEPWAMRLPSALLATGVAWLVYLLGAGWFGRGVGLIAAFLAAVNPSMHTLVHGYIFSDHVDVALVFYVTLSAVLSARATGTGRWTDAAMAGVATGLAFLSKTYPGLIVAGVVALMALLRLTGRCGRIGQFCLSGRQWTAFIAGAALSAAPWMVACAVRFPREFWYEQAHALMHLTRDVEQFAAPWDRTVADYLLRLNHVFFAPLLVSLVLAGVRAWRRRDGRLLFLLLWWGGVVAVFSLATSKTPTATAIALPAGWLILAATAGRALTGDRVALAGLATCLVVGVFWPGAFPRQGWGYPPGGGFGSVLRENLWPWMHAGLGVIAAIVAAALGRFGGGSAGWRVYAGCVLATLLLPGVWLAYQYTRTAWRITEQNRTTPTFRELGQLASDRLPRDAILLIEETAKFQHVMAMFWASRACYPLGDAGLPVAVQPFLATGRPVYLVSLSERPLPSVGLADGRVIYRVPEVGR